MLDESLITKIVFAEIVGLLDLAVGLGVLVSSAGWGFRLV